jgi:trimethylamine---corrinoid protein Co-methyltransferase
MLSEIQTIHDASMSILNKTGMVFNHSHVLQILKKSGIRVEGQKAFFKEKQVLDAVATAPASFDFKAVNHQHDILIGDDRIEFAAGYGASKVVDIDGSVRNATIEDYITFLKLIQASAVFNVNGGPLVQPADIDPQKSLPLLAYLTILHSDKGLVVSNGDRENIDILMEMLEVVHGDSFRKGCPVAITIVNTLSPLRMDEAALEIVLQFAAHGQPVIISPCAMAGTTGPMTIGGTIAMSNAEALAGIAVHQLIRPGAPAVYGFQSTAADMQTGSIAIGSAERALCIVYGARLAKTYGLPCRGGGADNDAPYTDIQSGYESMLTLMATCQERMNFVIHSAGILGGFGAMSVDKFIVDLEIIGLVKRFIEGSAFTEDELALEVIDSVGPGGNFLTHPHTLRHCRHAVRSPLISVRGRLGRSGVQDDIYERIDRAKKRILCSFVPPPGAWDRAQALRSILSARGYPLDQLPKQATNRS